MNFILFCATPTRGVWRARVTLNFRSPRSQSFNLHSATLLSFLHHLLSFPCSSHRLPSLVIDPSLVFRCLHFITAVALSQHTERAFLTRLANPGRLPSSIFNYSRRTLFSRLHSARLFQHTPLAVCCSPSASRQYALHLSSRRRGLVVQGCHWSSITYHFCQRCDMGIPGSLGLTTDV